MEDRCFICTTKFGIFKHKETACGKCKCAICKECCHYDVKDNQNKSIKACKNCHEEFLHPNAAKRQKSPPLNFKRQLETHDDEATRRKRAVGGLSEIDLKIAERLDKLKAECYKEDITVDDLEKRLSKLSAEEKSVTLEEIEYRLAKLKGNRKPAVKVFGISKADNNAASSSKGDSDSVNKLIRQYTQEIEIENDTNNDDRVFHPEEIPRVTSEEQLIFSTQAQIKHDEKMESQDIEQNKIIEDRLRLLSGMSPGIDIEPESPILFDNEKDDYESEEKQVQRIIDMVTSENHLENKTKNKPHKLTHQKEVQEEDEEFPWCIICNDDATLRCKTCNEDLFCKRCFNECHDKNDRKHHSTVQYKPPKD